MIQKVSSGVSMLAISLGLSVLLKMWILWNSASATQTSLPSGVRAMPWLGQAYDTRGRGVLFQTSRHGTLVTSTVCGGGPGGGAAAGGPGGGGGGAGGGEE